MPSCGARWQLWGVIDLNLWLNQWLEILSRREGNGGICGVFTQLVESCDNR